MGDPTQLIGGQIGGEESLSEFAERILFTSVLDEKLRSPSYLSHETERPAKKHLIDGILPNRPSELSFDSGQKRLRQELKPHKGDLLDPSLRGRVLHTFAHHELISLELMALALLRFTDAPRAFRRGLAQVMVDEQRHCQLYLDRLTALGISFGSEPVGDYFWKSVATSPTATDFNARLSLIFEQANIDFTQHYGPLFRSIGDDATADALDIIYQDEVSHVGFGLHWFRQWRPKNEPEWDSFCALINAPLSPGRAKGTVYSVPGRRAAGFSDDFIERLRLWGGSTGRPPVIWHGNFDVEDELLDSAADDMESSPLTSSPKAKSARNKLRSTARQSFTPLLGWLTTRGDVVLCHDQLPSKPFQELLQKAKGFNPEWGLELLEYRDRTLGGLSPWGWSEQALTLLSPLLDGLTPVGRSSLPDMAKVKFRELSDKHWSHYLRDQVEEEFIRHAEPCKRFTFKDHEQIFLARPEDLKLLFDVMEQSRFERWVLKSLWGNAGRGHRHISLSSKTDISTMNWLKRQLHCGVIAEPWLSKVADLSFHGTVELGEVRYHGEVVGVVNQQGRFLGAQISPPMAVLPTRCKRFMNGDGKDKRRLGRVGRRITQCVGQILYEKGYQGPFGVDALIIEEAEDELALAPMIEVNPRWTMGRLALELRKTLDPSGRRGAQLKIYPPKDQVWEKLRASPPRWSEDGTWVGGIICLSDFWGDRLSGGQADVEQQKGLVVTLEPSR